MSKTTICGFEARLVLKVNGRWIEVINPFKQEAPHKSPELDFMRILDAAQAAEQRSRPLYREVNLDV
jgi:hypothetical protein